MLISVVIPAWNVSATIGRALDSVLIENLPAGFQVEAIVVDDGSDDSDELWRVVSRYRDVRRVVHSRNLGMCAGRNSGIAVSRGDIVIILDGDDELVADWPEVLALILKQWPEEINVGFAACVNNEGRVTAQEPDYTGLLTLEDILNERHAGEYLPMFRGEYVRANPYIDLQMRKSCGVVSYIHFAQDGPFWISNHILRFYHEQRPGSVTADWLRRDKAAETVRCYQALLAGCGDLYRERAPLVYRSKLLRLSVYLHFSGMKGKWRMWQAGASLRTLKATLGAATILLIGKELGKMIIAFAKRKGMVRRYG